MTKPKPGDQLPPARLPSLDGWRAVAILLVLGAHCIYATGFPDRLKPGFELYFDGSLGVRLFFVISGLLITWLMLVEAGETGGVSLKNFYIRRCLRIFPVYFAFVAVMAALHFSSIVTQAGWSWFGILTFTRNGFGYVNDTISGHLWSLSVEEQFYTLWPGLFILLGCGRNTRKMLGMLLVLVLTSFWVNGLNPTHGALPKCFDLPVESFRFVYCLAFGCMAAIVLKHHHAWLQIAFKKHSVATLSAASSLVVLPRALTHLKIGGLLLVQHGGSLQILGFTVLVLHSVIAPQFWPYRFLNFRIMRQIGVLSYSIYIWQQLFWGAPKNLPLREYWWCGIWIIPLLATTLLSYYGLERPLFRLRQKYHTTTK